MPSRLLLEASDRADERSRALHASLSLLNAFELRLDRTASAQDLASAESALGAELLPDWYDEWLQFERERYRQVRLHALEALASAFSRAGRHAQAVEAALGAVAAEP